MEQHPKRPGPGRPKGSGRYGEPTKAIRIPESRLDAVLSLIGDAKPPAWGGLDYLGGIVRESTIRRPLFTSRVPAGFPSPAEDYVEGGLDLNAYLVEHEAATFYVRVQGHSMTGAGILDGDVIAVDRALEARHGDIVLAVVDNELTVKELSMHGESIQLLPSNPDFAPITFRPGQEVTIWGVVKGVVRKLR
jgi:DNA polymerase V